MVTFFPPFPFQYLNICIDTFLHVYKLFPSNFDVERWMAQTAIRATC